MLTGDRSLAPPCDRGVPALARQPSEPAQPVARRERREAARRRNRNPTELPSSRPPWRSPLLVITVGALVVGGLVIAASSLGGRPVSTSSGNAPGTSAAANGSGRDDGLVRPTTDLPLSLATGRTLGKADAPATLEIWSDFQCPSCGLLVREVEPRLFADYLTPGYLRIVYRDRAFLGAESIDAAVAGRCADAQGKFWPYHDYLFFNQHGEDRGAFNRERLLAMADATGLARGEFETCLDSPQPRQAAIAETDEGERLGVATTPTLSIDGQLLPGAPVSDDQYRALGGVLRRSIEQGGGSFPPDLSAP